MGGEEKKEEKRDYACLKILFILLSLDHEFC